MVIVQIMEGKADPLIFKDFNVLSPIVPIAIKVFIDMCSVLLGWIKEIPFQRRHGDKRGRQYQTIMTVFRILLFTNGQLSVILNAAL